MKSTPLFAEKSLLHMAAACALSLAALIQPNPAFAQGPPGGPAPAQSAGSATAPAQPQSGGLLGTVQGFAGKVAPVAGQAVQAVRGGSPAAGQPQGQPQGQQPQGQNPTLTQTALGAVRTVAGQQPQGQQPQGQNPTLAQKAVGTVRTVAGKLGNKGQKPAATTPAQSAQRPAYPAATPAAPAAARPASRAGGPPS